MDKFVSRTRRKIPEVVHFDSFERSGSRPNNSCNINTHTSPILQLSYYYIHRCIYIFILPPPSSNHSSEKEKREKQNSRQSGWECDDCATRNDPNGKKVSKVNWWNESSAAVFHSFHPRTRHTHTKYYR
jgi:hypothetical protein